MKSVSEVGGSGIDFIVYGEGEGDGEILDGDGELTTVLRGERNWDDRYDDLAFFMASIYTSASLWQPFLLRCKPSR